MHPPTRRRVSGSVRSRTWHWQGTRGTARFHLGPRGAGGVMRRGIGVSYPPAWSAGAPDSRRRRAGRHAAGWSHPAPPSPSDFRVAICHRSTVKKRRACLHAAGTVAAERPGCRWLFVRDTVPLTYQENLTSRGATRMHRTRFTSCCRLRAKDGVVFLYGVKSLNPGLVQPISWVIRFFALKFFSLISSSKQ